MSGIELSSLYTPLHSVLQGLFDGSAILGGDRSFSTLLCLRSSYVAIEPGSIRAGGPTSQARTSSLLHTSSSKLSPWIPSLTLLCN